MGESFLHFEASIGSRLLPLQAVVEVIPMVRLNETRGEGNECYRGVLHFRGRMIPVFDFDATSRTAERPDAFLVVANSASREFALVASKIYDLVNVGEEDLSKLDTGAERCVSVASVDGQLVRIVDPECLFS